MKRLWIFVSILNAAQAAETQPLRLINPPGLVESTRRVFRRLGAPDAPAAAIAYARELAARPDQAGAREDWRRFDVALRFFFGRLRVLGLELDAERAHGEALKLLARRPRINDVYAELSAFEAAFGKLTRANVSPARAVTLALEVAELLARDPRTRAALLAPEARRARVRSSLERLYPRGLPDYAEHYVLTLAEEFGSESVLDATVDGYARALEFARSPRDERGLGLNGAAAHVAAATIVHRRVLTQAVQMEIDVYRAAIATMVASDGVSLATAHLFANAFARGFDFAHHQDVDEAVARLRAWLAFFQKPLAAGGLGDDPTIAARRVTEWAERIAPDVSPEDVIAAYERAYPREFVARLHAGVFDEAAARDRTLARLGDGFELVDLEARLDLAGLPRVKMADLVRVKRPSRARMWLRCAADLAGLRPAPPVR